MKEIPNPQIDLAFEFVRNTNRHIFLTGKAGTGKTTFLHQIKEEGQKRMVVVAPTGVAAINAGGMTIHSFFQLPFGPQLPGSTREDNRFRRFNSAKMNLIKSIDLLVIDEVSMVRADLLDSIDEVLRRYRDFGKPFGGVQLLMIGDLHQLPPVVKQDEWEMLRSVYETPYFFSSTALKKADPVTIELKHIYRQSDSEFIEILNKVRDNEMDPEVLRVLNSRYRADFRPGEEEGYITLTAHNNTAQDINNRKLAELNATSHIFFASISGDFPAHSYPTEEQLELKPGAQVMFVKNDLALERRYYNGKIGRITDIQGKVVCVRCPGEDRDIEVVPAEWKNLRYKLNEQTKEVKEEEIGAFTQYPLKLAWAITIHKSQGLTFERAIIDAQASFAPGQVYVALSRCKTFEGVVLRSKIEFHSVKTDGVVSSFTDDAVRNAPGRGDLLESKREYQKDLIRELFSFRGLQLQLDKANRQFLEQGRSLQGGGHQQLILLAEKCREHLLQVAAKFMPQLELYFQQAEMPEEYEPLQERVGKASTYFFDKVGAELLPDLKNIQVLSDNKAALKSVMERLEKLHQELFVKKAVFYTCKNGFTTASYIRAKADAAVDFTNAMKPSSHGGSQEGRIPSGLVHVELYRRLQRWRKDTAAALGLDAFDVLPVKSLTEIVQVLPGNMASLKRVKGFGEVKVQRYGQDIMDLVGAYCTEKQIPQGDLFFAQPKVDTKMVTFEKFRAGKTIDEIAAERNLVRGTIEGHLAHFVETGALDIGELMDLSAVQELEEFIASMEVPLASGVKEHFGEKYSYGEIRLVMASMKSNPLSGHK
jgi:hypothetical protein